MSTNVTTVYDSLCKKHHTTRRRIFKDSNGKFKEKLEIRECEKRTLYGSLPFEGNSKWIKDDLSDVDIDEEEQIADRKFYRKCAAGNNDMQPGISSNDNHRNHTVRSCDLMGSKMKCTLQQIIDKLKHDKMNVQDDQGVKKIFEKKGDCNNYSSGNEYSNGSAISKSYIR